MSDQTESDHGCIGGARHHCAACELKWSTAAQIESESDYGTADAWDGFEGYIGTKETAQVAAAIRSLEEQVRERNETVMRLGMQFTEAGTQLAKELAELRADRDRLAGEVERIRVQFDKAIARIEDMLEDDDGQAFKEAGKFLLRIKGHDHES